MRVEILGEVDGYPILFVNSRNPKSGASRLVAGGFHGNEPAGVLAILIYLESERLDPNLSFLPLVNPTGMFINTRNNVYKQDPNRGYCHKMGNLSKEGEILMNSSNKLVEASVDGFLSLHEDIDLKQFYLYSFEKASEPGDFSKSLALTAGKLCPVLPNSNLYGDNVESGIILNECDGSFEDYLFHSGSVRTACTESPGALALDVRIKANIALIKAFSSFEQ